MARATPGLLLFGLLVVATGAARAQSPPPAIAPVSPPVLRGGTDVPYPPDGQGDASVLLEIVVAPDGAVSEANGRGRRGTVRQQAAPPF